MPGSTPAPRRTLGQRLLIALTTVALVGAVATAGALAYSNSRLERLDRYDLSEVTRADELAAGDPQNYLLVGIDDATGLDEDDSVRANRDDVGLNTDSIMVLRVDPGERTASILSFPRDLWVPIAGTDTEQRLNAALATGGPARLIATIDETFGIPIHHYVQLGFAGFGDLVDLVDGVPVHFPRPTRSEDAGLVIEEPGCYTLGPRQALGFVRARSDFEVRDDEGVWRTDPRSDFSRVERQQLFMRLAVQRAIEKGIRDPGTLRRLVDLGIGSVRVDDALATDRLVDLGTRFRDFAPEDLVTHTLPVVDDLINGMEVVRLVEDEAEPILALFRGASAADAASIDPAEVTAQVLNGTGTDGQGGDVTDELTGLGFTMLASSDAAALGGPTTIRYVAGLEAEATALARAVAGPVDYEVADALDGADVQLITGDDWEGVADTLRPIDEVDAPSSDPGSDAEDEGDDTVTDGSGTSAADGPGDATEGGGTTTVPADQVEAAGPGDPGFFSVAAPGPDEDCPSTG